MCVEVILYNISIVFRDTVYMIDADLIMVV